MKVHGSLTLTRNETLTYFDAQGVQQTAPANTLAFDYVQSSLAPRGLKLGDADTLVADVSAYWNGDSGTIVISHEPMPGNVNSADVVVC